MSPCQPAGQQPIYGVAFCDDGGRWRDGISAFPADDAGLHGCENTAAENEESSARGRTFKGPKD